MTRPEDAAARAREEAERRRAEGAYTEDTAAGREPHEAGRVTPELLREWSLIEVDQELVYSTRRGGAPITAAKRALLRLLRQYTTELEAQQTRFNVGLLAYVRELEQRIAELEQREGE